MPLQTRISSKPIAEFHCTTVLAQGDILVRPPRVVRTGRNGILDRDLLWPDGEVPYVFFRTNFSECANRIRREKEGGQIQ